MRTKIGNKFQGKSAATSRSSIVLRFLAGCQPEEMGMFIDLLLEPVRHHAEGTLTQLALSRRHALKTELTSLLFTDDQVLVWRRWSEP